MKLYSLSTPGFATLKRDWFLASSQDDYEIRIKELPASFDTYYMGEGWADIIAVKIDTIIEAIVENMGSYFAYADLDVQFFGKTAAIIEDLLTNFDFVAQKDVCETMTIEEAPKMSGHLCAGLFGCRANHKTLKLWKDVKEFCKANPKKDDQHGLNFQLTQFDAQRKENPYEMQWDFLPRNFYGPGPDLKSQLWEPGVALLIPEDILTHHANWTIGLENKLAQLKYVRELVENANK